MRHMIILAMLMAMCPIIHAQGSDISLVIVPNSRNVVDLQASKGSTVREALSKALHGSGRVFVVISRRNDCWVGEASTPRERDRLITNAVSIIESLSDLPVFQNPSESITTLRRRLLSETNSLAVFSTLILGESSASVPMLNAMRFPTAGPEVDPPPPPPPPVPPFKILGWFLAAIMAVVVLWFIGSKMKKHLEARREESRKMVEQLEDRASGCEVDACRGFSLSLLALVVLGEGICGLAGFVVSARASELVKSPVAYIAVENKVSAERTHSVGSSLTQNAHIVYEDWLDVSGSAVRIREIAKQGIAQKILSGKSVVLGFFGDSARVYGRISTLAALDSAFTGMPLDKNTRLSDGLLAIARRVDSLRRAKIAPCITFYSDFVEDDIGNAASRYGVAFDLPKQGEADSTEILQSNNGELEWYALPGASIAMGLLILVVGARILKVRNPKQLNMPKIVSISTNQQEVAKRLDVLREKAFKIGPDLDADIRVFDGKSRSIRAKTEGGHLSFILHEHEKENDTLTITLGARRS